MALALAEGRKALWRSAPNPPVGCALVRDGQVIATGHTAEVGGPHAEATALADLHARGAHARGATAYVTLEPCSHHGRTPPCADALVREGVARVVVALADPNPLVAGRGVERLRAAGIDVTLLPPDHPQARAARDTMIGFLSRMVRQRPWVRMKIAGSLDGRTALDNGESQWITGPDARADGHAWRARASAVMTGVGTVLDDDPRLDVRAVQTPRQPWRVVLDTHWRTPPGSRLLQSPGTALVYGATAQGPEAAAAMARRQALVDAGATAIDAPTGADARPDLAWVLADLAARGVNELHLEAGARLNASVIQSGWVDEFLLYLAPKLIGPGRALADLPPLARLADATTLRFVDVALVGDDLRVVARPPGRDLF
ncbi:bifunctional diaminohydroxyphosphoribosylaminopyrimidine deaminase/5-amino-6-(5-phosphoribosylamino)uracil reductase RibD [Aquabacterium olei]|uniref:Riboflavin biosynthesis protein RibD n=2 Tax=Aquabacterium olei TaxID=1296669 RepID=A0A2U8FVG9_9BURK|nr:bifunctional diaminohydroxyphosphoribosylaminopyrimidine deaminase/5-amino-6-(5-phosphoribosylamino)uracil reductase RibD [Aquabacterium olei]